jgi:hypothetical protein
MLCEYTQCYFYHKIQTKRLFNLDKSWGIGVLWTYSSIYHLFLLIAQVRISFGKSQEYEVKWI